MPRTVFAMFANEADAERALLSVGAEATLLDSAIVSEGVAGRLTLDNLNLTETERSACEAQLKRQGFLLVLQTASDEDADNVLRMLRGMVGDSAPLMIAEPPQNGGSEQQPAAQAPRQQQVEEERLPVVEENLSVGKRRVIHGGVRVHSFTREVPVEEQIRLLEEEIRIESRPADRPLTEEEIASAGLLQGRVIEVAATREEAVVSKQVFVREELVVSKNVEQRIENINETVRRTEVELERLSPEEAGAART